MSAAEEIYEAMPNSGMVNWVGPGDPAAIGGYNFTSIAESFSPKAGNSSDRILCRANSNFADSSSSTAFQTPRFIVLDLAIRIIMT